ncbi:hypothetical protein [Pseudomonas fulva]|uniref:hypothetical protein n=1 Tax=Pseudomonas fulva TaxID=47880 RepID=UPI001F2A8386|nr:hypothetical protein [Pseudomonas fulva]
MQVKNHVQFDKVVIATMRYLAEQFPKPVDLRFEELGVVSGPAYKESEGNEVQTEHFAQHLFACDCVRFLIAEGYITGEVKYAWCSRVCLTSTGLDLIKARLSSLTQESYPS